MAERHDGFYARNATDILPQILLTPGLVTGVPSATCGAIGGQALPGNACIVNKNATTLADLQKYGKFGTYQTAYGDNIHIFGVTLAKEFAGVSVGAELSYRTNMPLQSNLINVLPAPLVASSPGSIATTAFPSHGTPGALGDTYHGPRERLPGVAAHGVVRQPQTCRPSSRGCRWRRSTRTWPCSRATPRIPASTRSTKNFAGLAINFTPTWFQVFPGVDLLAPLTWSRGLYGNAGVQLGGNKGAGNWSAGVAADIRQKYRVQLSYNGYFGNYSQTATGAMNVANGTFAALSDRGWVSLTFKTTF